MGVVGTIARPRAAQAEVRLPLDQIIQDEQADLFDPLQKGIIKENDIRDIGDILIGNAEGRMSSGQITLYKNNAGQGICDVTLAAKFVERARELKRGMELPLGGYFRG